MRYLASHGADSITQWGSHQAIGYQSTQTLVLGYLVTLDQANQIFHYTRELYYAEVCNVFAGSISPSFSLQTMQLKRPKIWSLDLQEQKRTRCRSTTGR